MDELLNDYKEQIEKEIGRGQRYERFKEITKEVSTPKDPKDFEKAFKNVTQPPKA